MYKVVTMPDGTFRVMETFGSFRMLKKVFKTESAAQKRADAMSAAARSE
ncbi:hypothetical protein SAMN05421776_11767 [Nocardia farcinica]|uniref:Uncharacterized protein n=1 Tax=Nocardia farcinica TaxID=37329 RepID=A0A0H5NWM4_NOCFR|nr:hypothetical protein CJ469_05675 [Nocardia farcinica]PFX06113.1 hypothetical protein CJ468_04973 [Nocardia farcinica]CRY79877.1 Uncharacterised protein [Nocardia farcinica]SIT33672.1 hypothetical protein SAMN05421776_11767 [Nocardia farcinica]